MLEEFRDIMLEHRMRSLVLEARHKSNAAQEDCYLYLPRSHLGGQDAGDEHNQQPVAHII